MTSLFGAGITIGASLSTNGSIGPDTGLRLTRYHSLIPMDQIQSESDRLKSALSELREPSNDPCGVSD